jgi:hypothetical protein
MLSHGLDTALGRRFAALNPGKMVSRLMGQVRLISNRGKVLQSNITMANCKTAIYRV